MANARQCDRCGKFYTYNGSSAIDRIMCKTYNGSTRNISIDDPYYRMDLCESCLNELKGWWIKIAYLSEVNKTNSEEDK